MAPRIPKAADNLLPSMSETARMAITNDISVIPNTLRLLAPKPPDIFLNNRAKAMIPSKSIRYSVLGLDGKKLVMEEN